MRRLSSMGLHRCLAFVFIAVFAACKSPPPAPSPSPTAAPTPRPALSFELETDEGVLRVLDDGSIAHALFGEDEYGEWQMLVDLDEVGKVALKKATEENIDRMMRILLGAELLLEARIMAPIGDGRMLLTGLSAEQAKILKDILGPRAAGE